MKYLKIIAVSIFSALLFQACMQEEITYDFDYLEAPGKVSVTYNVAQDNSGVLTMIPNAEGAQIFQINFGDSDSEEFFEFKVGETVTHTYNEGAYTVKVVAVGITSLETEYAQNIVISFKAPENLIASIVKDQQNPKKVTVKATADFTTIMEWYFGDVDNEEGVVVLPGEEIVHYYESPGDYTVKVIAKSAGIATTEYTEVLSIPAATDPVNLPVNFESFTINYAFSDFGNALSEVVDNPYKGDGNNSDKVARQIKKTGAETWAGAFLTLENPINFNNKLFKVKVWSPKKDAVVKLKVENLTDGNISAEVDAKTSVNNQWEDLSFDFSSIDDSKEYQKIVLFFDFGNAGDGTAYFYDDIKLLPASIPSSSLLEDFENQLPAFTVFGNIAEITQMDNPDVSGLNKSSKVAKLEKSSGAETWAGTYFSPSANIDLENYSKIGLKVYSPKSNIIVKVKLENADASVTHEKDLNITSANSWNDLIYDFSDAPDAEYVKVVVFFDFGNNGDGSIYYFDDVRLVGDENISGIKFQTFESEAPVFTDFGNIAKVVVVDNPDATGKNTTSKVAKMVKSSGSETWAGAYFETTDILDLTTYSKIKVRVWSPKSGITIKMKLENDGASTTHEVDVVNTASNSWEELEYDFSTAPQANYKRVVIFFDFGTSGDDSVYYFDEFELIN